MNNEYQFVTNTVEETISLASQLTKYLTAGDTIGLIGEMGAGKTHFTKGIAQGLQIESIINSPTFILIKEYDGKIPLYHMDLQRLEQEENLGFDEYFYGEGITIVEWADKIPNILPEEILLIYFTKITDNKRLLRFVPYGTHYLKLCEEFKEHVHISN